MKLRRRMMQTENPMHIIMDTRTNAPVLAICYAQGWCGHSNYMTKEEAEAVTSIGTVFKGKTTITHFEELKYFTGLTEIPANAFDSCTKLVKYKIPNSIITIGYRAFYNSARVTNFELVIPEGVTTIGSLAFYTCPNISKIYVPSTATSIGSNAFASIKVIHWDSPVNPNAENCPDVTEFSSSVYTVVDGMLIKSGTTLFSCPKKKTNAYIPSGITDIGAYAYANNTTPNLIIPEGVESVQYRGFYGVANASGWVFPSTLKYIYGDSFRSATYTRVYLPSGFIRAEGTALAPSGNYNHIVVVNKTTPPEFNTRYLFSTPSNYEYIGYVPQGYRSNYPIAANKFFDVWYVKECREIPTWFDHTDYTSRKTSIDRLYNLESIILKCTYNISTAGTNTTLCYNYEDTLEEDMFVDGIYLTHNTQAILHNFSSTGNHKVYVFSNIIEHNMFDGVSELTNIVLPSTITTIKQYAFRNCSNLATINITNVTTIENGAFYNCTSLPLDTIDAILEINANAFDE